MRQNNEGSQVYLIFLNLNTYIQCLDCFENLVLLGSKTSQKLKLKGLKRLYNPLSDQILQQTFANFMSVLGTQVVKRKCYQVYFFIRILAKMRANENLISVILTNQ